jgi:putative lumazine-binding protein
MTEEMSMKRIAIVALALTIAGLAGQAQSGASAEKDAVAAAAMDYLVALYEAKPELVARSVHTDLSKRGYFRKKGETTFSSAPMSYQQLYDLAGTWNKDGKRPVATAPKDVVVYEVLNQTASAKVTALWGIDYMHLAKYEGKWKIVNILWQEPPQ